MFTRQLNSLFTMGLVVSMMSGCRSEKNVEKNVEGEEMDIELLSSAFSEGESIPRQYTCDGRDVSPPLRWSGLPEGCASVALICDDPDAPMGTWVHWVIFNIPADSTSLPEGIPAKEALSDGAKQGRNDFRRIGYGGPCPPRGAAHRYNFRIYALDATLDLQAGASKKELLKAMGGHILGEGQLMGKYKR